MQAGEPHYVLEDQVGFLLRLAYQRHIAIYAAKTPGDITPVQFSMLYRLMHERAPVSQNALGRLVGMDAATTKGVVARLLARGLIEKTSDDDDRRRHTLSITAAGRAVMENHVPLMRSVSAATLAPLDAAEQDLLVALLKKLK